MCSQHREMPHTSADETGTTPLVSLPGGLTDFTVAAAIQQEE